MYCLIFRRLARPSSQDWNWKILFYAAVLWILALVTIVGLEGCYFSLRLQVFVYQYNKPEDKFHTIFYVNNQFSLKLTVKLIEVILNYNFKVQMRAEMKFPIFWRLSYLPVSQFSILQSCFSLFEVLEWAQSKLCFSCITQLLEAHLYSSSPGFIKRLAGERSYQSQSTFLSPLISQQKHCNKNISLNNNTAPHTIW